MSEPVLLVDHDDGVATVTLNRPRSMNALSRELRGALLGAFQDISADPAVRLLSFFTIIERSNQWIISTKMVTHRARLQKRTRMSLWITWWGMATHR